MQMNNVQILMAGLLISSLTGLPTLQKRHGGEDHGAAQNADPKPHAPAFEVPDENYKIYTNSNGIYKCSSGLVDGASQNQSGDANQNNSQNNSQNNNASNNQSGHSDHNSNSQTQNGSNSTNGTQSNQNTNSQNNSNSQSGNSSNGNQSTQNSATQNNSNQKNSYAQKKDEHNGADHGGSYSPNKSATPAEKKKGGMLDGIPVVGGLLSSLGLDSLLGGITSMYG